MTAVAASGYAAPQGLLDFMRARPLHEWADASGQRWAWRDSGAAAPGVALLPGALGNGDVAWKIAQALERDFRVLTIHYPSGVGPVRLSQGLHELLGHLRAGPVALWGSSYGAWWAQQFALQHGADLRALWLGNTFTDGADVAGSPLFDAQWLQAASAAEVVERWHAATIARPDSELRQLQLYMLHHGLPAEAFRQRLQQVAQAPALPVGVDIPRLVLSGCADDAIITPAVSARLRARYPGAQVVALDTGGHYPHVTEAETLVPQLRRWASVRQS